MSITLSDGSNEQSFNQVSDVGSEARYMASASTLREPLLLIRKSTIQEPGSNKSDRFLTQVVLGKFNAAGVFGQVKVNLTVEAPRVGPSSEDVIRACTIIKSALANTDFVTDMLRGAR